MRRALAEFYKYKLNRVLAFPKSIYLHLLQDTKDLNFEVDD